MASCKFCTLLTESPKIQYNYNEAKEHSKTHSTQLSKIDEGVPLRKIIEQCFPDYAAAYHGKISMKSNPQSVVKLCHSIFAWKKSSKREYSATHVACKKCGVDICISGDQNCLKTSKAIAHAQSHTRLNLFECRKCGREFSTKVSARTHLIQAHRTKALHVAHMKDKSDEFADEIYAMVKSCFDGSKPKEANNQANSRPTREATVRGRTKGSELTVERQLFCYRLIRKFTEDRSIKCRLCSTLINSRFKKAKAYQCTSVMHHALLHLQKPIFRCRHCPETSSSTCVLDKHLRKEHALRLAGNHEFLGDRYHHEILDTLRKCYDGDAPVDSKRGSVTSIKGEARLRAVTKGSKLVVERQLYCYRLIRKLPSDQNGKVQCRYCTKCIVAKGTNTLLHTITHVGKPMFRCKICDHACCTKPDIYGHLKEEHALCGANNYDFSADQYHREIMDMIRKCYGDRTEEAMKEEDDVSDDEPPNSTETEPVVCQKKRSYGSHLAIKRRVLCDQLVRKFVDQDGKVQCHLCDRGINGCNVGEKKSTSYKYAMHHVLLHLDKPLNRCRICFKTFISRQCVAQHLKNIHKLPFADNFDDLTDQFHEEIMTMLQKCYDAASDGDQSSFDTHSDETKTTRPTQLKLDVQRRELCSELVGKFTAQDGTIQCRLCEERLKIKDHRGSKSYKLAMEHAQEHLGKALALCNICSKGFVKREKMAQHLKQVHRLPFTNNFECLLDQHHEEILTTLRQCYDADEPLE